MASFKQLVAVAQRAPLRVGEPPGGAPTAAMCRPTASCVSAAGASPCPRPRQPSHLFAGGTAVRAMSTAGAWIGDESGGDRRGHNRHRALGDLGLRPFNSRGTNGDAVGTAAGVPGWLGAARRPCPPHRITGGRPRWGDLLDAALTHSLARHTPRSRLLLQRPSPRTRATCRRRTRTTGCTAPSVRAGVRWRWQRHTTPSVRSAHLSPSLTHARRPVIPHAHAPHAAADLLKFKHYHTQKEMVHYTSYLLA
jgi:hypothetical protein